MYGNGISNFSPNKRGFLKIPVFLSLFGGVKSRRSELYAYIRLGPHQLDKRGFIGSLVL